MPFANLTLRQFSSKKTNFIVDKLKQTTKNNKRMIEIKGLDGSNKKEKTAKKVVPNTPSFIADTFRKEKKSPITK